jgi:hypothetical protein
MLCLFLFNLGLDVIMTNLCSNSSSFQRCYGSNIFTFCTEFYPILNYIRTRNITLVHLQLDAQNSCLFTYNIFIKILYMFLALSCSSSGGLRRNCVYAASGIVTLCRCLSCAPVKKELNRCTRQSPAESDDTRGCIYTITT